MATLDLTAREREILVALTTKVRLFSLGQLARAFWGRTADPEASARRRLRRLVASDYLEQGRANIHPELELKEPVFAWTPGDPAPPFGPVSYQLGRRWSEPNQPTLFFTATRKAARLMGGRGGPVRRPYQLNHDLHLSTVFLHYRDTRPDDAAAWLGEDLLPDPSPGDKHPDAVLRAPTGGTTLVVEFAGAYDVPHLERVHRHCFAHSLPYELW